MEVAAVACSTRSTLEPKLRRTTGDFCFGLSDTHGRVFESDGAEVVTDNVSFQFLHGATLDYVEELISSSFRVVSNPNSEGSCGCGTSFTPAPPP
mmetsp:Transcript_24140/g.57260  ORF Transcript_24140/g.57260 Transcript_24140/m.57260 type:complete len:95 (-) Transcript_24140:28-312(-)